MAQGLDQFRMSKYWLIVFAVVPNPVWFMLVLSPDVLFACMVCIFYLNYFADRWSNSNVALWICMIVLALLTRPNGYSILLFVFVDMTIRHLLYGHFHILAIVGIVMMLIVFTLYLYPYFITEMRLTQKANFYFGILPGEYTTGLFAALPEWLDIISSWLALFGAKLLYFVGLRPTYGETSIALVLLRAAPGILLLPGLIHMAIYLPRRQQLFVAFFCLPIFLGPTQDRYNLPILAILFLHGAIVFEIAIRKALRSGRYLSRSLSGRPNL